MIGINTAKQIKCRSISEKQLGERSMYKPFIFLLLFLAASFDIYAFNASLKSRYNTLYKYNLHQVGTIDALLKGEYEGVMSLEDINMIVDTGVGTTSKLGEVVGINSKFYVADVNGKLKKLDNKTEFPYLTAVRFNSDKSFKVNNVENLNSFKSLLKEQNCSSDIFYAMKITGLFRSVDAMSEESLKDKPVPLQDWLKSNQKKFTFKNVRGTIVMFKYPENAAGLEKGGYHAHFVSSDETFGGHVLDFSIVKGDVLLQNIYSMTLLLAQPEDDKKTPMRNKSGNI